MIDNKLFIMICFLLIFPIDSFNYHRRHRHQKRTLEVDFDGFGGRFYFCSYNFLNFHWGSLLILKDF